MGIITEHRIKETFKHNILSVIFDSDSFFYAVSDINNNLNIAVKYQIEVDPLKEIPEFIKQETLADHYYSTVNVFSKIDQFTFVPNDEYNYGNEGTFINNSFKHDQEEIGIDVSSREGINIVHAYDSIFQESLHPLNQEKNFKHLSLAYMEGIAEDGVFVTVYDKSMIVFVRNEGRFIFYNQFQTKTNEDRLYFIMLTFDQLNLDPIATPFYLDGNSNVIGSSMPLLEKYIGNFKDALPTFSNLDDGKDVRDLYLASICE